MVDFEILMNLLKIPKADRDILFFQLVKKEKELDLKFNWDGSIDWEIKEKEKER